MRAKQFACVAGVLGAGVLAAWPFRQYALPPPAVPASAPLDLTLRQADVTLAGSPPGDDSPAFGLDLTDQARLEEVRARHPLDEANGALDRLRQGKAGLRAVLVP